MQYLPASFWGQVLGILSFGFLILIGYIYFWFRYLRDDPTLGTILDAIILIRLLFIPLLVLNFLALYWLLYGGNPDLSILLFEAALIIEVPTFIYFFVTNRRLLLHRRLPSPDELEHQD